MNRTTPRLTRLITLFRWIIPPVLCGLGLIYLIWENLDVDQLPVSSPQFLIGMALLCIAGPLITFLSLTWAEHSAAAFEHAEQARIRKQHQLIALNAIGEAVNQSLELDAVLQHTIERVLYVLHLESGEVRLIENGQLVLHVAQGVSPEFTAAEPVIPLGQCLCGKSAQTGELGAVEDLRVPSLSHTACACEQFRSVLTVPVRTTTRVVGVIHVASKTPRHFDSDDRALLIGIGNQVGAAIEKAQLHAQLKSLNQELEMRVGERTRELLEAQGELIHKAQTLQEILKEERRVEERTRERIAHDLHDGLQQLIVGALFETQAARDVVNYRPETAVARIGDAQTMLHRIEAEMKRAIYNLRPVALDAHGLVPALRECVASFSHVAQVYCDLNITGVPCRFDRDAEVAVFRITQEALNNIENHARAKACRVAVTWSARELAVEIVDDGAGFDLDIITQQARTHLGLIGMRERAESVGGNFEISSCLGQGTRVAVHVPLAENEL